MTASASTSRVRLAPMMRAGAPRVPAWIVVSAGLLGCSGSAGSSNGAGWGQQFAAAMCARIFSCCDAAEAGQLGYTSEAQCASTLGAQQQTSLDQGLSTGMVRFDPAAALTCVDDIGLTSCAALFSNLGRLTTPPSCSAVTPGTGQTGAPCGDLDFVCASDDCESDYCAPPSCRTVICPAGQYCDSYQPRLCSRTGGRRGVHVQRRVRSLDRLPRGKLRASAARWIDLHRGHRLHERRLPADFGPDQRIRMQRAPTRRLDLHEFQRVPER